MFARGTGKEHWDEVMKNQKTHIQRWHKLQDLVGDHNNSLDLPDCGKSRSRRGSSTLGLPDSGIGRRPRSASVCTFKSKK